MLQLRGTAFLTVLLVLGSVAVAEEAPPSEAARFIKDQGLEDYHALCAKFFTALLESKPEAANEILVQSLPPSAQTPSRDHFRALCTQISGRLADYTVEDVELVGHASISSKALALYYVLNTDREPVLVTMVPFRHQGVWRTHTWQFDATLMTILDHLRGVTRFSGKMVVPVKREAKKT